MKLPKKINRYCPKCNTKTEHKVDVVSTGHKRGTLKKGSIARMKLRGSIPGRGNKGKSSRRAVKQRKMKTKATTRKVLIYTCQTCKKSTQAKKSRRVSKIMFE